MCYLLLLFSRKYSDWFHLKIYINAVVFINVKNMLQSNLYKMATLLGLLKSGLLGLVDVL